MTSVIEDHTHNYGNIKGILEHIFRLGSTANQSLNVNNTISHKNTENPKDSQSAFPSRVYKKLNKCPDQP